MKNEKIRTVIQEWKETELPDTKQRSVDIDYLLKTDHIIDILGVRRAGKTYLMYLIMKNLLESRIEKDSIIYLNFESRFLYPLTNELLEELLDYIYEEDLLKKHKKVFLFLDEIQNTPKWERWIRNIYDKYKGKIKIFISGSSSKLGKREVSSLLTGRHISLVLFPLDFKEFLIFRGFDVDLNEISYSIKKQAKLKFLLREYLRFGGFPEVALVGNEFIKEKILKSYYDDILYRDIIERFRLREISVLENFLKFLFLNISSYFSYKKAADYLASIGIKVSTRTLLRYTSVLEEVFLFFFLPIFTKKVRNRLKYPRKIYCVDVGLRRVVGGRFSEDIGRIIENIVFLKLKTEEYKKPGLEIYYWKDRNNREVDFLIKEGLTVKELIQVCSNIDDKKTKEREIKSLVEAMKEFKLKQGIIITEDYEDEENINGAKIKYIPLWKWLLLR